jgi:CRP-like cAMP-binding protein
MHLGGQLPVGAQMDLRRFFFFSKLEDPEMDDLRSLFHKETLQASQALWKEGELNSKIVLLQEGSMALFKKNESGNCEQLAILKPGTAYAELAPLFSTRKAITTLSALEHCYFVYADFSTILQWIEIHPSASVRFYRAISEAMAARLAVSYEHIQNLRPLFSGFNKHRH